MAKCTPEMIKENKRADKEYERRYPFGDLCSCRIPLDGLYPDYIEEVFFAHYKRGHGRRANMLRKAARVGGLCWDLRRYYPEIDVW